MWWWTAYHPRGKRAALYFYYWIQVGGNKGLQLPEVTPERESRIRELQFLMTRVVYFTRGRPNGYRSLYINKLQPLYAIARFSELHGCSVIQVLERKEMLDAFLDTLPGHLCAKWMSWIKFLAELDPIEQLGFQLANLTCWDKLSEQAKKYRVSSRQHAPLPTRIYSGLINNISREMDDIEVHKVQLLGALRDAIGEYVVAKKHQTSRNIDVGPSVIEQYQLGDYLARRGLTSELRGLGAAITEVFRICKLQIHVFTGMRDQEATYLPFHCMEAVKGKHGRKHCLVVGITTKLHGSRARRTKWVTTENDGFRAIRLAQEFAAIIYEGLDITPSANEKDKDNHPLFPSTEYLPWGRIDLTTKQVSPRGLEFAAASDTCRARLCPSITNADIAELEDVDPFRAWREEEEFGVGQVWPLTAHQLRRSLALYANASGLVRLSSLRRQLQHLTREMSLYYGRGSTFCKNFIAEDPDGFKKHVAPEWQEAEQEAQCLAFVREVLNSDEPMFGGAGNFYERKKERGEVMSREAVKKQVKAGLLSYKDGPLGGCLNPEPCKSAKGLNLIDTVCATDVCKHLVGKHSKIIQVIRYKRAAMAHIDSNSITYAVEKEDLDRLEQVEVAWRPNDAPAVSSSGDMHV